MGGKGGIPIEREGGEWGWEVNLWREKERDGEREREREGGEGREVFKLILIYL